VERDTRERLRLKKQYWYFWNMGGVSRMHYFVNSF